MPDLSLHPSGARKRFAIFQIGDAEADSFPSFLPQTLVLAPSLMHVLESLSASPMYFITKRDKTKKRKLPVRAIVYATVLVVEHKKGQAEPCARTTCQMQ